MFYFEGLRSFQIGRDHQIFAQFGKRADNLAASASSLLLVARSFALIGSYLTPVGLFRKLILSV